MARIGVLARGELGWELAALDRELASGLACEVDPNFQTTS